MEKCEICGKKMILCKECETEYCLDCDGGNKTTCAYCLEDDEDDDEDNDDE
ncbi:MAG: hypothetical protein PHW04_02325 [Candidatus Wallbacteria bacterium]|nr:hypothetical protein [Candidatus Wallbacteria bacterium]